MTVPAPYVYNATVTRVIDGDTIEMVAEHGFFLRTGPIPVRLLGINARELKEPGGLEALAHLSGLLPAGTPVVLTTAKPDKYAPRWLAHVEAPSIPDVAGHLIDTGWAAPWDGRGPRPLPPWPIPTAAPEGP